MIAIISPSKTQDFSALPQDIGHSQLRLADESKTLVADLKKMEAAEIGNLMEVSDKLAELNYERFQNWQLPFTPDNAKQAVLAFKGDVYSGLEAEKYSEKELAYAQDHLRILSGLYGLLRPLDLIQPYRLEMKTKLQNPRGNDLYKFWGERLTELLNEDLQQDKAGVLVNLASNEYYKALQPKKIKGTIITPVFKEFKNGSYRTIAIFAKKARGYMADYIISQQVEEPEKLKLFDRDGYSYDDKLSKGNEWVFVR